jgi:hypothetical protein
MSDNPSLLSEATPPENSRFFMNVAESAIVGTAFSLGSYALSCGAAKGSSFSVALDHASFFARAAGIISWGVGLAKVGEHLGARFIKEAEPSPNASAFDLAMVEPLKKGLGVGILGLTAWQLGDIGLKYAKTITPNAHAPLLSYASNTLVGMGMVAGCSMFFSMFDGAGKALSRPTTTLDTSPNARHQGQVAEVQREHAL